MASSTNAPFKIGFSPPFLNFLITLAGLFPDSDNIIVVLPLSKSFNSPKSVSDSDIALSKKVFFTTESFTLELKHSLLSLEVCIASSPAISVK